MMEVEDDIFEISDFTNATPWEGFIADIENIFHQWGLAKSDSAAEATSPQKQHRKSERVSYAGRTFVVSLEVGGLKRIPGKDQDSSDERSWPKAMMEMMDNSADFPPMAHHIARWFGVSEFVLLAPDEGAESLHSQAQANFMLSSLAIAINNTGCSTPVFIQMHQKWRQMYMGVCEGGRIRTNFSTVHLHHIPPHFNHLAGLLEVFKSKLRCPLPQMDPVEVAVRLTYTLKHWDVEQWPVEPLSDIDKEIDSLYLKTLRVGAISDPIQELHLSTVWPHLTEELVIDTASHSNLNPLLAPMWTVRVQLVDNPTCLLAEQLLSFLKLCYRDETMTQLLGRKRAQQGELSTGDSYSHALSRLTNPTADLGSPFFSSVVYSASQRLGEIKSGSGTEEQEAIPSKDLDVVLKHLFPDAHEDASVAVETSSAGGLVGGDVWRRLRSAPEGSLATLLATALCIINNEYGTRAFCTVWKEIALELRYRWEKGIPICNLPEGPPDMMCCLLHQKLQMLNCCIQHKLVHQQRLQAYSEESKSPDTHSAISSQPSNARFSSEVLLGPQDEMSLEYLTPKSSLTFNPAPENSSIEDIPRSRDDDDDSTNGSDDEFYEAFETQEEQTVEQESRSETGEVSKTARTRHAQESSNVQCPKIEAVSPASESVDAGADSVGMSSSHGVLEGEGEGKGEGERKGGRREKRLGALKPCGSLVLIATGEPLYIPVTQEHPPMTEDMLWEQEKVLSNLGTSEEAALVRAKMQSFGLVSDMQAFKAANPGCLLEDFVRWYSPRDWIEEEGEDTSSSATEPLDTNQTSEERQNRAPFALNTEGKSSEHREETALHRSPESHSGATSEPVPSNQSDVLESPPSNQSNAPESSPNNQSDAVKLPTSENQNEGENRTSALHSKFSVQEDCGGEEGEGWSEEWVEEWDFVSEEEKPQVNDSDRKDEEDGENEGEESEGGESEGGGSEDGESEGGESEGAQDEQERRDEDQEEEEEGTGEGKTEVQKLPKQYARGRLSARMQQPSNIWVEVWHSSAPLPAYKQKRLFDDTKEAEKVLHFFTGFKPSDLALSLMPMLLHSAIRALERKQREKPLSAVDSFLQDATALLTTVYQPTLEALPKYQECIALLSQAEHLLASAHSLRVKLRQGLELMGSAGEESAVQELDANIEKILEGPELMIGEPNSSATGLALQGLLAAQAAARDLEEHDISASMKIEVTTDAFPPASGREFILRSTLPRPSSSSHPSPHRMFCVLTKGEFRLAGAFSVDTNLM